MLHNLISIYISNITTLYPDVYHSNLQYSKDIIALKSKALVYFYFSQKYSKIFEADANDMYQSSSNDKTKELFVQNLSSYYQDWLMPDIASHILQLIIEDESQETLPELKIDCFHILHSVYSKFLSFGMVFNESFYPAIMKHLKALSQGQQQQGGIGYKLEV